MPKGSYTKRDLGTIGKTYCRLMEEITIRDELLNAALAGLLPNVPAESNHPNLRSRKVAEFCYLQLRMICELIALGCLTVHGDIHGTRNSRISTSNKADWIINVLEKLHPKFYPIPCKQITDNKGKVIRWDNIEEQSLTKKNLLDLYHECGKHLHRENLKSLLSNHQTEFDFSRIKKWADGTWSLLNHHQIQLIDPDLMLVGLMKSKITSRAQFSFWAKERGNQYRCVVTVSLDSSLCS